ncbi:methionine S-methyltransferase-like isoform X5 [Cynara cardunculus var. scolymus]|uniref:methionine S-methyltransferase-like isoform X5 n=1 Tax=Cynara cardunculus var. scolymus TaxID=59895 RepID=UPI000D62EA99|nr:methionine S-methyltransferase-like isoform X5 [Cynara cardunculus var. scolymus]
MAAVKGLYVSIEEFLKHCSQSGDSAYSAFRSLLERLEDPKTRTEARIFFAHLKKKIENDGASDHCLDTYHFLIQDVYLGQSEGYENRNKLTAMVIPSIFLPEDWSFTFYEGLNRHPDTIFKDKIVAELGCGNGWISIAIAERWSPLKVYGLDINPRAVKISWINLYLNAFDDNGQPVYDQEKKTLLDRVEFYESDLLSYCRDNHIELERIVGCIPQILNPNPDAMSKLITENASEDFLYSLSNYCALQNVVVFPSRATAIENALQLFAPRLAIVDDHLSRHLPKEWLTSLEMEQNINNKSSTNGITVIEAPRQSDLMIELIKKLRPQVVVTGMAQFEAVTSSAFEHILSTTREIGSRLFIDISHQFELSSLPNSNGVLKYLARTPLPSHVAVICGLLKNQVYTDLEVAFVISEEQIICDALSKSVELLQGNTALISQYYYGCIFHELLSFQLPDRHQPAEREAENAKCSEMIGFSSSAISVLSNAEFSLRETDNSSLIHMDVDQIFLPTPTAVKAAIFESFARQNVTESECDVTPSLKKFIKTAYGLSTDNNTEFIYADSPLSIFSKLVLCCIQGGGSLCFPAASNGNYVSTAKFLNAKIVQIHTISDEGFKLTEKHLSSVLETVSKPWVYISGPTISPTGLIYSNEEMESILNVCAKYGAKVIIDTSFSGVEFNSKGWNGWNLEGSLAKLTSGKSTFSVCLLGGLFFKMLTGGLTFGFLVLNQRFLVDAFNIFSGLNKPHSTIRYTAKKLLDLREQKPGELLATTEEQGKLLGGRHKQLKATLERCGWEVLEAHAGVSVIAKPSTYMGKRFELKKDGSTWKANLNDSNIREAMFRATGLCINGASWIGIPGYCRFTLALEDTDFDRALECIAKFKKLVE